MQTIRPPQRAVVKVKKRWPPKTAVVKVRKRRPPKRPRTSSLNHAGNKCCKDTQAMNTGLYFFVH